MPRTDRKGRTELLPQEALAAGWRLWASLLVVSVGGLIAVLWTQPASAAASAADGRLAGSVLVGLAMVWLVLLGAAVLILRSYCFRAQWDGRPVEPGSYLKGMYQVWGVLVVGALLSVLGAILMGSVLPGGLVVLAVLLLLVFARPSGRALGV